MGIAIELGRIADVGKELLDHLRLSSAPPSQYPRSPDYRDIAVALTLSDDLTVYVPTDEVASVSGSDDWEAGRCRVTMKDGTEFEVERHVGHVAYLVWGNRIAWEGS